jgi:hypothetical protein
MMKRKLWKPICLWVIVIALLVSAIAVVSAMSSPNFRLDWYVNISGAGGGRSSSAQSVANFTVGQNAAGVSSSTNYNLKVGYWGAFPMKSYLYLPSVMQNP